ncbi:orotidine-5'-phosphate decarboxylase [Thermoanaerobacterium sp. RBIITD]|uniref:orotidine-5'-phosphate decarboxylase n=1 Tax=Thermoanaerobacterium sp. RBIITD TaxID=1550240 RepID=UPI000BB99E0B|nr:orotidine-5'-phosphate decarboxylase [Thermoanaerobacterium sp. RBIITD]SNX52637.1 orotidine-5'-phosphate decarboxylase [Thermoanaerobacterium sp. RBIITD]
MFADELINNIKIKNNPTVVGLDPRIENIPEFIKEIAFKKNGNNIKGICEALYLFNKGIIDSVYDLVPAVKIQIAFYEVYGIEGLKVFFKTAEYAKEKGLIVIADVKRGDIADVAEMYSRAYLQNEYIDAITVNPYMGEDTILPYIHDVIEFGKGLFILVKTSNKGSYVIQDLETSDGHVYENVANMVNRISKTVKGKYGYSSIGAVVGATYPEEAKILRKEMPGSFFLVPGYGAQGASADDIVSCFDDNGFGAIVNSSRKIIFAYKSLYWKDVYSEYEYAQASRAEVLLMRGMINNALMKRKYIAC